jgi:proton glutamate symport protein
MIGPSHDSPAAAGNGRRWPSLTQWILVAMVVGTAVGWLFPATAVTLRPLSTIFLRLIKSLVVPLVFSTLVVGVAGHGDDLRRVGRLALRTLVYFEVMTTIALVFGLVAANMARPGAGVSLGPSVGGVAAPVAAAKITLAATLEHVVPQSIAESAATNDVLQVVVFAVIFGVALARVPNGPRGVMLGFCQSLAEVSFKMVGLIMLYAPIGIGAAIAVTIGQNGPAVLVGLGKLVLTMYVALILFTGGVMVPVAVAFRVPLRVFLRAVREPALIAFSTSTSEAALPRAMELMEQIGVPARIVGFVIPTGYTFNLVGSTLYLAVAALFAAQAGHVPFPLDTQLLLMFTLMLTSKGIAGVPRAALVVLSGAVGAFGLPLQAIAVILGVDAFMDMGRTSINVVGNCLAAAVMARWEGVPLGEGREAATVLPGIEPVTVE